MVVMKVRFLLTDNKKVTYGIGSTIKHLPISFGLRKKGETYVYFLTFIAREFSIEPCLGS
jgi:hypothetical protein